MLLNNLSKLYDLLPLVAEEGGFCTTIPRKDLLHSVTATGNIAVTEAQLLLIERLFDSLSLLDNEQLAQGQWRFVSFSASLLARSLLQTLADSDSRLLERHFWLSDQPEPVITEQRQILHELETRRVGLHRHQCAKPIRYVHVAWAFIKLDGHFVLHHREDKHRPDVANYVPIGGKLHLCDFEESVSQRDALAFLQQPAQAAIFKALSTTLQREVLEETALRFGVHYHFSEWRPLTPYRQVVGESLFLRKLFWASLPQKQQKLRDRYACGCPSRPASLVEYPTRGIQHRSRNDSTRFRKACIFTTQKDAS